MPASREPEGHAAVRNRRSGRGPAGRAAGQGRENTLTRLPSGSLKIMDRLPHGCVVGGRTQPTPRAATRGYSASTSPAAKSRIISGGGCARREHAVPARYSVNRRREKPTDAGPAGTS